MEEFTPAASTTLVDVADLACTDGDRLTARFASSSAGKSTGWFQRSRRRQQRCLTT